ncbi:hypothetical protein BC332_13963 [Capsicum chinense]|nr:hypothetical protein BC332_13963 [Capsicum chinense]
MVNFRDQATPYPLLEIANDEQYSPASVLILKVHPPVIGAFSLDRGSPDMFLHLDKWSKKEEIDVLDFNKVINTTAFVPHSSTHDKESAATYPKAGPCYIELSPISVFKIASLMAHGERFALAIPVLASIYRGLTEITTSTNLGVGDIIFPIQYVYGWIGMPIGRTNLVGQNKIILKVPLRPSDQGKPSTSSLVKSKTSPLPSKSSPSRGKLVKTGK